MDRIKKYLESRKTRNAQFIVKANEELKKNAASGRLEIAQRGNTILYRKFDVSGKSKYLSDADARDLRELAQKRYLQKVVTVANRENAWLENVINTIPTKTVEDIYQDNPIRRKLITPYIESDEEYIERWISKPYIKKGFVDGDPEFWTDRGERVRSKSEKFIANKLYKLGIPYVYEYPIKLKNGWTVHPDFKLLDVVNRKDIIHEHFGLMDDPGYARDCVTKIKEYARVGLHIGDRLIVTFESSNCPFDDYYYEKQLKAIGLIP